MSLTGNVYYQGIGMAEAANKGSKAALLMASRVGQRIKDNKG